MKHKAYLALGSNIENRKNYLTSAIKCISNIVDTHIVGVSNIYETDPVGYTEQNRFLNMAVSVETGLDPLDLLDELQKIENDLKRVRKIRWGPRTIDIDILLYDELKMDHPRLTIPHPRMSERAFVLIPLKDIYPDFELDGCSIDSMIDRCSDRSGVKKIDQ